MRIISWNVRFDNKKAMSLIAQAMSHDPDILCLQEVRGELIPLIRTTYPHVFVYGCMEVSHLDIQKQNFLCTITRTRSNNIKVINYEQQKYTSFWEKFYFSKINRWTERHAALVISIPIQNGLLTIVNIHFSSASGPIERVNNFNFIMNILRDHPYPNIYCGDFNVVDNFLFRYTGGWIRGLTKAEYKIDERQIFDTAFNNFGLVNVFDRMSTYILPWRGMQLDHILVPTYVKVTNKMIGKMRFASDHRMILVDISNSYYGL